MGCCARFVFLYHSITKYEVQGNWYVWSPLFRRQTSGAIMSQECFLSSECRQRHAKIQRPNAHYCPEASQLLQVNKAICLCLFHPQWYCLYINDNITAGEIDKDRWLYSPGAVVRLQDSSAHSVSGTIELFAYHTVVQNHRWAIATRQLFNGTWNAPTLSRLVWTMYNFVLRNDFIDYPDTDTFMNSCTGVNSNVIISDDETVVYKVLNRQSI